MKSAYTRRDLLRPTALRRAEASPFVDRDPAKARASHLLRRTAMSVHPERVESLGSMSWDDAVHDVLDDAADSHTARSTTVPSAEDWNEVSLWWINRMTDPTNGLLDRMAWFWHGLLTTNAWKVDGGLLVADQLARLRGHALGNFRTLLQSFIASGALLQYLDADGSMASNPNENLARELMELFTVGRGHYSQDDVRGAARALAGWEVNDEEVSFDRTNAFVAPLIFLGEQADWNTQMIIDRLCDHPATAARVSARLWKQLVGTDLDDRAATELGQFWQSRELEILPLVERILTDPQFEVRRLNRPRGGLEWFCAAKAAVGGRTKDIWQLETLGQTPYLPPNVAGWPDDDRWLSPGSILARSSVTHNLGIEEQVAFDNRAISTNGLLDACGLHAVSDATVAALDGVYTIEDLSPEGAHYARWRLALTCPEFHLS